MSKMLAALKNLSARTNTVPMPQAPAVAEPTVAPVGLTAEAVFASAASEPAAADPVLPPVDHARRMKDLLRRHLSSPVLTEVVPRPDIDGETDEPPRAANLVSRDFLPAAKKLDAWSPPPADEEPAPEAAPPMPSVAAPLDLMANLLATIEEPSEPAEEVTLHLSTPLEEIQAQISSEAAKLSEIAEPSAAAEPADPPAAVDLPVATVDQPSLAEPTAAEPPAAEVEAPASPLMHLSQEAPLVARPPQEEPPAPVATRVQPARTISRPKTQLEQRVLDDLSHPSRSQPYRELAERLKQDLRLLTGRCLLFAGVGPASHADDVLPFVARLLAEENQEVLLIDADFARAGLTIGLGGLKETGLGELMEAAGRGETLVLPTLLPNVSLLPAGRQSLPDAMGVVEQVTQLIARLAERHSLILIDAGRHSGPLAPALSRLCDATYLVVRLGATDARGASVALQSFRASGARVMGCVATSGATGAAA